MNAPVQSSAIRPDAALIRDLEAAHYHPLWDRYKRITPIAPRDPEVPMHWRWGPFEALADRAAHEVPIEDIERRAIICAHPHFSGATVTTSNLIGAFTILEPGDHAVPHRHTAAAIRFATRAEGAVTIVNGRRCEMLPGDLVLTPPMCWHGHINESDHRTYWFDAANMPLVCGLDASFFEPGSRDDGEFWKVDEGDERLYATAGLADASEHATAVDAPKYRYPGEATRRMLDALPPRSDGARLMRYVHPHHGGAVMPTIDCYAMRLTHGAVTRPTRTTHNSIVLVVSGEGRSVIGDQTFEWGPHDVFTIPHWTWATHEARTAGADLFLVTDRVVYQSLGLLRIESK